MGIYFSFLTEYLLALNLPEFWYYKQSYILLLSRHDKNHDGYGILFLIPNCMTAELTSFIYLYWVKIWAKWGKEAFKLYLVFFFMLFKKCFCMTPNHSSWFTNFPHPSLRSSTAHGITMTSVFMPFPRLERSCLSLTISAQLRLVSHSCTP